MSYETVIWEQDGGVGRITLNRPDSLNAWTTEFGQELKQVVTGEAADPSVRAVLVTGAGRGFSSGADLKEGFDPRRTACRTCAGACTSSTTRSSSACASWRSRSWPPSTAPRWGSAASLALACDLVLAAESAFFGLAFVNIGLMPDGGSTLFVPAAVGKARAFEMALLGERVPARTRRSSGVSSTACTQTRSCSTSPTRWSSASPRARRAPTPRPSSALNQRFYPELESQLELEADLQHALARTRDFQEGVMAFVAKREAAFEGA